VPLVPRPPWEPLEIPPGPDPATLQEFQVLAAGDMAPLEGATDQAGLDVAQVSAATIDAEAAMLELGLDLAAGAEELDAMQLEAAGDTLVPELLAATEQDAEILAASNDAVEAGADLPEDSGVAAAALVRLPPAPVS